MRDLWRSEAHEARAGLPLVLQDAAAAMGDGAHRFTCTAATGIKGGVRHWPRLSLPMTRAERLSAT